MPILKLLFFYAVVVGVGVLITRYWPVARDAWVNTMISAGGTDPSNPFTAGENQVLAEPPFMRSLSALLIGIGALTVSLPVAWVYTHTRRYRLDPSLVQSVIILPIVVAGIVAVVQHSIALAFSLAGIVAAVRFRNTLKDPKDAVYIFLALGIGIAAGVRAVDIALVLSALFNCVVLVLWKYNLAAIYPGDAGRDLLSIGDPSLMIANTTAQRDALRWRLAKEAGNDEMDGILLVHTNNVEGARMSVELTLAQSGTRWHVVDKFRNRDGITTFAMLLQLDKKMDAMDLLGELDERWSEEISAAEYIPYRVAAQKEKSE